MKFVHCTILWFHVNCHHRMFGDVLKYQFIVQNTKSFTYYWKISRRFPSFNWLLVLTLYGISKNIFINYLYLKMYLQNITIFIWCYSINVFFFINFHSFLKFQWLNITLLCQIFQHNIWSNHKKQKTTFFVIILMINNNLYQWFTKHVSEMLQLKVLKMVNI